jgi:putative NADH-flavin reductase
VLVIGGTSGIGLQTVRLALERGHEVTALARRAPSQPLHSAHLRYLQGDITDAPTMATAVAGQDVVVTSIGAAPGRDPVTVFSSGTRTVIAAMQSNGVSRLIAITGIGAGESRGHGGFFYDRVIMPLVLRRVYEDKEREESIIRGSAVDWTIVRPGFLTRGPATHAYQVVRGLEGVRSGSITRADVAEFVVAAAESGQHVREALLLSN